MSRHLQKTPRRVANPIAWELLGWALVCVAVVIVAFVAWGGAS